MGIGRFLLASFDYVRPKDPKISLASSSLLAYLQSIFNQDSKHNLGNGLNCLSLNHRQYNVKNASLEHLLQTCIKDIDDIRPDIFATGVYVWNESVIMELFKHLRATSLMPKFVILGGPQITYNGLGTLERSYPFADFFIRGYGEESLGSLLQSIVEGNFHSEIPGVHVKGRADKGAKSPYQLSSLPSPLLSPNLVEHTGFIRWETKRGCPFECAFCQHKDSYEKRLKCNPNRISEEQEWIIKNGINDISVVDPIFNSGGPEHLQHLKGFLDLGYRGRLNMQARFEMIKPEFLEICTELQDNGVQVELEFGIQTIITQESKVIKRLNNLKRVVKAATELHERNIPFEVSLIYGLPEQTLTSFVFSVDWVQQFIQPSSLRAWPLMLLKGTSLYDLKEKYKIREKCLDESLEELDSTRQYNGIPHVVECSSFTEAEWNEMKSVAMKINSDVELECIDEA